MDKVESLYIIKTKDEQHLQRRGSDQFIHVAGNNGNHWFNVTIYDSTGNTTLGTFTEKRFLYLNAYTQVNYTWWTSLAAGSYKMLVQLVNSTGAYVVYVDSPSTSTLWTITCM